MKYVLILLLATFSFTSVAQDKEPAPVESIEGLIAELLDQITIEKGETMDTAAIRSLFHPTAQLTMLSSGDSAFAESVSLDDFLTLLKDPYYEQGYSEKEIHKVVDEYNGIAQVFQSFWGKDSEGESEMGMNSYQLVNYKNRWWIISLLWTIVPEGEGLPEKYGGK